MSEWDFKNRPTCYGYEYPLEDYDNPPRDTAEIEVALVGDPWARDDTDDLIEISVCHFLGKQAKYSTTDLLWVKLPREQVEELHRVLGNILEYTNE